MTMCWSMLFSIRVEFHGAPAQAVGHEPVGVPVARCGVDVGGEVLPDRRRREDGLGIALDGDVREVRRPRFKLRSDPVHVGLTSFRKLVRRSTSVAYSRMVYGSWPN